MITWRTEKRKISDLKPAEYNPRQANEKEWLDLETSLERFNLADPIVINKNNNVIGGHFRLKVLQKRGIEDVDARVPDRELTLDEERELNLRLNKNLGQWDIGALANFDEEMLKDVGFDSKELDRIFQLDVKPEDDDMPESAPPVAKTGDVYLLGRHRVMCGDSTKREDVERLMDGKKADMLWTDPPYGVSYGDKNKFLNAIGPPNRIEENIENDTLAPEASQSLWLGVWKSAIEVMREGAVYYICSADADLMMMMMMMMSINDSGLKLKQSLVWVKNNIVLGRRDYKCAHENILYGWKGSGHKFYGRSGESSVFEFDKPHSSKLHPTMKPVKLIEHAILNSSQWDEVVLDLFLGSGSTLIACEKISRICYGMEIDAKYCDVIIKRWEDYTGKKAEKINGPQAQI